VSSPILEIQLIAAVVAVACALPGVFLVLRRLSLMSDAISHSILLGIVLAFLVVQDLSSPLLIAAAAATGVITVGLVQVLNGTGLVKEDAAIGLVFPALFSVGVIVISRYAGDVHLDTDAVLLGELAFAPFERLEAGGRDLGPRHLWVMGVILLLNVGFIATFWKELKLTSFDPALAAALGFAPGLVHYGFMTLVSVTAVGAFDAVGSILVVALMIAPPSAAYLLTDGLGRMMGLSALLAAGSAIAGYWLAHLLDASIAGSMATMTGIVFLVALLFARGRGLVAQAKRRRFQRLDFAESMLTIHLMNHEGTAEAEEEARRDHLTQHLRWEDRFASRVVRRAELHGLIESRGAVLELTERGRDRARRAISHREASPVPADQRPDGTVAR